MIWSWLQGRLHRDEGDMDRDDMHQPVEGEGPVQGVAPSLVAAIDADRLGEATDEELLEEIRRRYDNVVVILHRNHNDFRWMQYCGSVFTVLGLMTWAVEWMKKNRVR